MLYTSGVVGTRQSGGWSGKTRVPHGQVDDGPIHRSCKSEALVLRTSSIMF